MDVREKLVELVNDVLMYLPWGEIQKDTAECIVDRMMDHDVTVQEWISVNDRLPEDDSDVLAYSRIGEESRIYPACYSNGVWFDCVFNAPVTDTTTHWMPMPQPPKGE